MAVPITPLWQFMGFNTQGDLGGWTFYTSRRRGLVFYPQAPPLNPASQLQRAQRNKFKLIANLWRDLTSQQRQNWNTATNRAHLRITGYNLFTFWQLSGDRAAIATIERQANLKLL